MMEASQSLRGGGIVCSHNKQIKLSNQQNYNPKLGKLFSKFNHNIQIIQQKASLVVNQKEQSDILLAIQWFFLQEENIYELNKTVLGVMKSYDLIKEGIRCLLNSCLIYIKSDSMICLHILQITTFLSKVIFSYHQMNDERFLQLEDQKQFVDICEELKLQIEIEKNDLIQNQIEIFLSLTQISFEIAPKNSKEKQENILKYLRSILLSTCQMKPSIELFEQLYFGAQQFYQQYNNNIKKKFYELYYRLDIFQWEVINYFRDIQSKCLDKIIYQIESMYETAIKSSANWEDHYLWVYVIGKILIFNPLLQKKQLNVVISTLNLQEKSINQIWEEYKSKRFIIQTNCSNDQAIILFNQLENSKSQLIDKIILGYSFSGWEQFLQLKGFLMNEQSDKIKFTFGSYLRSKLDLQHKENEIDINIKVVEKLEKFLSFLISDKLLSLIQSNLCILEEVIFIRENFQSESILNLKISQSSYKEQIKFRITQLEQFHQNVLDILKIFLLYLGHYNLQVDQFDINQLTDYQQIRYLLNLLNSTLEQSIDQKKDRIHFKKEQQKSESNQINVEYSLLQKELKYIQVKLQKLNQNEKQFLLLHNQLQKLITNQNYQANKFIAKAQSIIQLINKLQIFISEQENFQFQQFDTVKCFKFQLHKLYYYLEQKNEQLKNDFQNSIRDFKENYIRYHEIEDIGTIEELQSIKSKSQPTNFMFDLRFNFLKLNSNLISFKESFQKLLSSAKPVDLQEILKVVEFDDFLLKAIKSYPIRMNTYYIDLNILEINSLHITEIDLKNKLSNHKGIIQYQLFKFQLEEKKINSEIADLDFIQKEFGETFIEESTSHQFFHHINSILKNIQIERSLQHVNMNAQYLNEDFLAIEKEKYENLFRELRRFQGQHDILEVKQLINQTEIVIQSYKNSSYKHFTVSQILLRKALSNLLNYAKQYEDYFQKINYQAPSISESKNNSYMTKLNYLIQLLKIQKIRNQKQKNILEKMSKDFEQLFDSLDLIQIFENGDQIEMLQNFNSYFQSNIQSFEKFQWTQFDQQQIENVNEQFDFERTLIYLQKEAEGEHIQDTKTEVQLSKALNYLNNLKSIIKEQLISTKYFYNEAQLDFEVIFNHIKKLYFGDKEKVINILQYEENSHLELGFFQNFKQKLNDYKNKHEWKIKQGLIFTIIQISSNCFSNTIISYCQQALVQLWGKEKDQRIRNILKNRSTLSMQMKILQRDWKSQNDKIESEMELMLSKIDDLREEISHEVNLNQLDKKLIKLDQTTQKLDEYISNISEMGCQLKINIQFVNHLRKSLARVEGKINYMKQQLSKFGNDIQFLRGKSAVQLLEIRKWKVLKDAVSKNLKSIYIPLKTQEKNANGVELPRSNLINLEQFDDQKGKVNEFLLDGQQTVLLIHGIAGSGKSTAAKKIEEFIWNLHEKKRIFNDRLLVPIYISLPSLKTPAIEAVTEALCSSEYGFDELQLRECKELLEKREFRFLLIFDGYDEMNLENIQKNLYRTNKLQHYWFNPLVIFTTRSEIFTSQNYSEWFAPEDKMRLKEVKLLKFDNEQMRQYLEKFSLLSMKMLIYDAYEWSNQIQNQVLLDEKKFEMIWEKIISQLTTKQFSKVNKFSLLNEKQIENILLLLKNDEFIQFKNIEALRSVEINLQKLWSVEKYENIMKMINVDKLVETPYLMEIIVWVLPSMLSKAAEIINLKKNFIKNFQHMISEAFKSVYLTQMYREEKKNLRKQKNRIQKDIKFIELENLNKIDYSHIAHYVWQQIEQDQILVRFQFNQDFKLHKEQFINIIERVNLQKMFLDSQVVNKFQIENDLIFDLICDSLKEQNLTSFDFYSEFIRQHYLKQIEKQRNLGKLINIERFLYDLQQYSTRLAKKMSQKQLTVIQYKEQGLLYNEVENIENIWLNEYFNDDGQDGQYKKDVRSCTLIQQKGSSYQFVHKSIQEYLIAADLYKLLSQSQDIDQQIFDLILEILQRRDQASDCLEFLSQDEIGKYFDSKYKSQSLSFYQKQQKLIHVQKNINQLHILIKDVRAHDFNKINYSTEIYTQTRQYLIKKISKDINIIQFLKFLVRLTAIDNTFISSGSNSINLLVEMYVDLTNQDFQNIIIKNTSIAGGNFVKSNLTGSIFEDVNMNGANFNGAILIKCLWKNVKINELHKMIGHRQCVNSVYFSPDGAILASGSFDKSIRLWDVKTGKKISELIGHTQAVNSVCFSPDGCFIASGSWDSTIRIWDAKTEEQKLLLTRHTDSVFSVCFSPDGTTLASGSKDSSIRLWNLKTGKQKLEIIRKTKVVYSLCFTPDGSAIASGGQDYSVYLWDVKTGEKISEFHGHTQAVSSVCFTPDGSSIASGSLDKLICLWDVKTGELKQKFNQHKSVAYSVNFSPDGTTLASGNQDLSIRLWDVKTGEQKLVLTGHTDAVLSVCFSPDGTALASGSQDKSIQLWDVKTEKLSQFNGHNDIVFQVCFTPDGSAIASCSQDNSICLWDTKTGEQKQEFKGHNENVFSVSFSPDGTTLASGSLDKTIRLWDVKTGEQKSFLIRHTDAVNSVCFSPDGTQLAFGSWSKSVCLWDVQTEEQMFELKGHEQIVTSVCFSPDGNILASGSQDKTIRLWDVKTGEQKSFLIKHKDAVNSVCFSPDGTQLAFGSYDNSVRLWDVQTEEQMFELKGHEQNVTSVCFSPDGTTIASGSYDKTIRLWDGKTGEQKSNLLGSNDMVYSVCFSPDGDTLASCSQDKSIQLWDVKNRQYMSHTDSISSVCFSPDGTTLASCSFDKSIQLWDVKTKKWQLEFNGHKGGVYSVCFSPDGTTIASCSQDKTIRLWDVRTGEQKSELYGHVGSVFSVFFSSDGTKLASGSSDKSIRLWDVENGKFMSQLNGHTDSVSSVCFSPDCSTLASGSYDQQIRLWDVKTLKKNSELKGHTDAISSLCFSPDGQSLTSGSFDKSIRLWDVKTGQQKLQLNIHKDIVTTVCFSPDGTTLASSGLDLSIRLWDLKTEKYKSYLNIHKDIVTSICFSPDCSTLASGSLDKSINFLDVKVRQPKAELFEQSDVISQVCIPLHYTPLASSSFDQSTLQNLNHRKQNLELYGHTDVITSVCFSSDGSTLASGSLDKSIRYWDAQTGKQKLEINGHSGGVFTISFSCDGKKQASGGYDKSIQLWDVKTGEQQFILNGHTDAISSLCFSPDSLTLASGSFDKSIRLWNLQFGKQQLELNKHHMPVTSIIFSPDGALLASGSLDKSIRLWYVNNGEQKSLLIGHTDVVSSVCFTPDGTSLASGSWDKSIRLWDVKTGQQKFELNGHYGNVSSVCFSPDGTTLASGGWDKSIRLWDFNSGKQKTELNGQNGFVTSICFSPKGDMLASGSWDNAVRIFFLQNSNFNFSQIIQPFSKQSFRSLISNIVKLEISKTHKFQVYETVIFKEQIINQKGMNLRLFFQSKGSLNLNNE